MIYYPPQATGPSDHGVLWLEKNKQRALLEHATGTYKTATGLLCADYFEKSEYSRHIYSTGMVSENWETHSWCSSPLVRLLNAGVITGSGLERLYRIS